MKAPIKIYVDESRISPLGSLLDAIVPDYRVEASDICYIRKDTLLKWAKEHYTGLDITKRDMWDGGYNCAIKELINKLNEM